MENQNRDQNTPVEGYPVAPARNGNEQQMRAVEAQLDLSAVALDSPVQHVDIPSAPNSKSRFAGIEKQLLRKMTLAALVVLAIGGVTAGVVNYLQRQSDLRSATQADTSKLNSQYDTVNIPLSAFSKADTGTLSQAAVLTINGRLVVNNTLVLAPVNQPVNGISGQLYYDKSSNKLRYFNGTDFVDLLDSTTQAPALAQTNVGGLSGAINLGAGLAANGNTLSNTGVTSLQGLSGNVTLAAGRGIAINGATITASGVQNVTAGSGIVVSDDGNGNVVVTSTQQAGYDFASLAANGIVISNGDGTLASVGSTAAGQCLVSGNGAPSWQACPGTASTGNVTTAGGTPGRLARFSGTQALDDSLLSETGSTINIAGDVNLSAGFRYFINGSQIGTANLADASNICLVSLANCAPATGSFIQNGTVQQASANFNISGTGTASTLNATSALQLGGVSINTAGTLSNVAYLNQANAFTGNLSVGGNFSISTGTVTFGNLTSGIVSSNASGRLSSGVLDRNNPTLLTGTLTVANGGTGLNMITANGLVYGNGTATAGVTVAGTTGQIVIANASSIPTFVSVSGDIGISATGVVAIGNGVVGNAKLTNSSLTVTAGSNLSGGGLVALGSSITIDVASSPSFGGTVNSVGGYQLNGNQIVTSAGVLQNVTANANIITSGTLAIARGGTGLSALPGNGQLLIGNGSGYTLGGLVAGTGIAITNAAGTITVSVDNTVCTTANNCMNPAPGSSYYIQNGTSQQAGSNFNISGTGIADILDAASALRLNGISINTAGTLSNVAYLNQSNAFTGSITVGGNLTITSGVVTIGSMGAGLVRSDASGVLASFVLDRNDSALLSGTLATGYGGTGVTGTATNGQLLIGNGSGYTLATLTGANGITITNAAGAITVGLNNTVCTTNNTCESPPAAGSANYIQNGTVQQASADFNISGGGTADRFNALSGFFINNVSINTAGTLSNVAYLNQANAFTGNLSVGGSSTFTVGTGVVRFGSLSTGIVQSSATGVLSSSAVDRNAAAFFTNALSVANGGTGNTSFTTNSVLYGNGTGSITSTAVGTAGQLLLANGSGVPTFTTASGDIAISASGVTTIANGVVSNAKLVNDSLTVTAGTNLTGGGLVALGSTVTLNVASAPTFAGNVDAASFSRAGTTVITSSSVLQNVTANANIITSGTLPIARGGTGVTTLPGNGQLLIGNGSGYNVATLTAGSGVTITNAAGAITVSIDNSVCTTANNCPNPAPGSSFYIQNGTGQQTTANFNIDGVGIASAFNAITAYRLNGVDINNAGTLSNVAYLNQSNAFAGNLSVTGSNTLTTGTGAVTFGSLGNGLVQANASGVLSSGSVSRNNSALFTDSLSVANGGTGLSATPTNGQVLIGNGSGYTLANLTGSNGINITNAAGAITVALNNTVCTSSNPCSSPPAAGSANYIQNGTVQQASADFNISGGGTANTFNAISAFQLNGSNINTAGTLSNVAYLNQANTFAGNLAVDTGYNFSVASGSVTFGGLGAGIVQTNASGVLSSGQVDRNSASLFANSLSVANGGTGRATLAANGLLFGNGTGAVNVAAAGTAGQLLLANASGVPTFMSASGDIGITASGVVTIQNGVVTNAKLANSSVTINSSANLVGGGTVALGGTLNLTVASSPSFAGTVNSVGGYQLNGNDVVTNGGALQNVTANANIITSGTFGINRGGTGVSTAPTHGQLLIGNGSGYTLAGLIQGGGITITNAAGSITVAVDGTICTTANNCGYQAGGGGSGDYIQNTTTQQASANFNISGTGKAGTLNATTALQTAGVTRIDASGNVTAADISASGALGVTGNATFGGNIAGTNASAMNYLMGALGLGTTSPQSGDALTIANGKFISAVDASGTGYVNILSVNANNEIQLGAALNVDGGILLPTDGGQVVLADMNLTAASAAGTPGSYTFGVGNTNVLTVYAQSDGAGSATNQRVGVGTGISPQYTLDVGGDINTTTQYRLGGNTVIDNAGNFLFRNSGFTSSLNSGTLTANRTITLPNASGIVCIDSNNCGYLTTTAASTSYIQNTSTQQAGSNFNISGTGVATTFNATTALQTNGTTRIDGSGNVTAANLTATGAATFTGTAGSTALSVKGAPSGSADVFNVKLASNASALYVTSTGVTYLTTGAVVQSGLTVSGGLNLVNGSYNATVAAGTLTANRSFTLPDADGVLCTTATCAANGSGSFINNGTSLQSGNFFIRSAATNAVTARVQGSNGQSVDTFQVQDYQGNNFLSVSNAGNVAASNQFTTGGAVGIQAGASSNKALQITTNASNQTGLQIDAGTAANATNVFAAYGSTYGLTFNGAGVLNNTGSTTLGGTLNVSGASTLAALTATNGTFSGTLSLSNSGFTNTIATATLTANQTITLPNATGIICLQNSTSCGFAPATGSSGYIQNGTAVQTGSNFNIDGNGVIGGTLAVTGNATFTSGITSTVSSGYMFRNVVGSETNARFQINPTGTLSWGPGGATAPDTSLFRPSSTPGMLSVGSALGVNITSKIGMLSVLATNSSIGIGIRAGASQAADLMQLQNNDGTIVYAKFDADGDLTVPTITTTGNATIGGNLTVTGGVTAATVNTTTGFRINGAAASGQFLRGDGTNFVSSALQAGDIPSGSANYIQNTSTAQAGASFNIGANGAIGGTLTVTGDASFSRIAASGSSTMGYLEVGGVGVGTVGNAQRQIIFYGGANNHSFEIGRQDGVASTPFFDLHSGATAVDYDVRILATGGTGTNSGGTLNLNAANVNAVNGNLQLGGNTVITSARVLQNVTADAGLITTGTLGSARLSGAYTGITAVGTLSSLAVTNNASVGGTLNVVGGYQADGTAGITVNCLAGQVLQGAAVKGGIVTGGTCVGGTTIGGTFQFSANTSSPSGFSNMNWNQEVFKNGITHSNTTNAADITIITPGYYAMSGSMIGDMAATGQYRDFYFSVNGSYISSATSHVNADGANNNRFVRSSLSTVYYYLNAGDVVRMVTGGNGTYTVYGGYSTYMSIFYVSPSFGGGGGGGGSSVSLQASTPGTPDTGNFNISGSGTIGTNLNVSGITNTANLGVGANFGTGVNFSLQSNAAASIAQVTRAASGQTGQLLLLQDSGGINLSGFGPSGQLQFYNGVYRTDISTATLSTNRSIVFPDSSGTVCLSSNNCGFGTSSGSFINNSTTLQSGAHMNIQGTSGNVVSAIRAASGSTADTLQIFGNAGSKSVYVSGAGSFYADNGVSIAGFGNPSPTSGQKYAMAISSGDVVNVALAIKPFSSGQTADLFQIQDASSNVVARFTATGALNVSGAATLGSLSITNNASVGGNINTVGVYQAGGTSGVTTTCSAGQVLQGVTVKGGIVTGGTCVGGTNIGATFQITNGSNTSPTGTSNLNWNVEVNKNGVTHSNSTDPSAITIVTSGYYAMSGSFAGATAASGQYRDYNVTVNGTNVATASSQSNPDTNNPIFIRSALGTIYYYLNAGDIVRVSTTGSGSFTYNLGTWTYFSIFNMNANYGGAGTPTNIGGTFNLSASQPINTSAATAIQWTNEVNVSGLTHSTSSNAQNVTVVTPGYYLLSAVAEHANSAGGIYRDLYITINGTSIARGNGAPDTAGTAGLSKAVIATQYRYLNAGDVINVYTAGASGTTTIIGSDRTYLSVALANSLVSTGASGGSFINNNSTTQSAANMNIQSNSVSTPTAVLRAVSGQTADALQIQDSSGSPLSNIAADGSIGVGIAQTSDITPTFTKLADPATLPGGTGTSVAYSPDSQYLAVGQGGAPYIGIYKRSGNTFTKLADPTSLPNNVVNGVGWSPDGLYLSVAYGSSPFIITYKRLGDTFVRLGDPATLPASTGVSATWSPDGQYLTVGHLSSPFMTIYKRTGDGLTKLADPTSPGAAVYDAAWSPDGQYLVTGTFGSNNIAIYKQSGDTFTKLTNPATLPSGNVLGVSWSSDGQLVTVAHNNSPFITTYKRSGDTFAKLANPATLPSGNSSDVSWSPDGQFLSVSSFTAPAISIYKRSGDTLTKIANPASLPPTQGYDIGWAPNGQYLTVGSDASPYITTYSVSIASTATNTPTLANLTVAGRACIGAATCNDTLGVAGTVGVQGFLTATNLNATNYLQTGGVTRLDGSGNLVNINSIRVNGAVSVNNGGLYVDNGGITAVTKNDINATAGWFLNQTSLGNTVGNYTSIGRLEGVGSNRIYLDQLLVRSANGTDWNTASLVFQRVTDVSNQSSLAFTGTGICINTPNYKCSAALGVTGNIVASGSITANTTPDIAEHIAAAPDVEAADVVMADPVNTERVVRASGVYNSAAVGVISDGSSSFMINPYGGLNGEKRADTKPLVLAGRVPVKVTNESGDIKPGDHLTVSSTTGHAMKATRAGATIGTALGFFNGTTGTVLVLVNPSYYDPFDGNNLQASTATISTLNAVNATITNLTVGTLNITGNITVGGHIITAGNTPVITQNTGLCTDTALTINGNDTAGEIVLTTGTGCANNGLATGTLGSVTFSTPYGKAPRIVMTPSNAKAATLAKTFIDGDTITANGFNVQTLDTLAPGTTYRWYYHSLE